MNRLAMTIVVTALALVGCDRSPTAAALEDTSDFLSATESFRDFGSWSVHVNALVTDQLSAEIASQYDIARSSTRAMLNVSVIGNESAEGMRAEVNVSATNLSGQLRNLSMREIAEETAVYYIGETAISDGETLIFTIDITPEGQGTQTVRYMQQFFVD